MDTLAPISTLVYAGTATYVFEGGLNQGLPKHQHAYSHAVSCVKGAIVVRKEGRQKVLTPESAPMNLIAGQWHEIEIIEEDSMFLNVFAEGKY